MLSNIGETNVTTNAATITWTTDEASDSLVRYGITSSYGATANDYAFVTDHSVSLSNLSGQIDAMRSTWPQDVEKHSIKLRNTA